MDNLLDDLDDLPISVDMKTKSASTKNLNVGSAMTISAKEGPAPAQEEDANVTSV